MVVVVGGSKANEWEVFFDPAGVCVGTGMWGSIVGRATSLELPCQR